MRISCASVLCLVVLLVAPQTAIKLEIGTKLNRKYIPKKATKLIATHPSQLRPFIERTIDGVKYVIAYDEKTREIKYIHTTDKKFRTVDGLRVLGELSLKREQLEFFQAGKFERQLLQMIGIRLWDTICLSALICLAASRMPNLRWSSLLAFPKVAISSGGAIQFGVDYLRSDDESY